MKYIAVLDTDDYEDFAFFEDGKEKYLHGIDAYSVNGEWIYLPFKPLEQESKSEWEHDHEILKAYSDGANEILNKIRAEIEQIAKPNELGGRGNGKSIRYGLCMALEIIDKYKADKKPTCGNCKEWGTVNCTETYREPTENDDICDSFKAESEDK